MKRKNKKGWFNDRYEHKLAGMGYSPRAKSKTKLNQNNKKHQIKDIKHWHKSGEKEDYIVWRHDYTNNAVTVKRNTKDVGELLATRVGDEEALRYDWILQVPTFEVEGVNKERWGFDDKKEAVESAKNYMKNYPELKKGYDKLIKEIKEKLDEED